MMHLLTEEYIASVKAYLSGAILAADLADLYMKKFLADERPIPDDEFFVLDEIFACLDGYTDDSELIQSNPSIYLDDTELRNCLTNAVAKLTS